MGRGLDGKVAIVTGAAQGIGLEIARALAREGSTVVISDIQVDKGRAAAAELGKAAVFVACDISDSAQVNSLVGGTAERFGRLDTMVNNAAYHCGDPARNRVPINDYPEDTWLKTIEVGLTGTFYCCKAAANQMVRQRSGSIINIASVAGVVALRLQIGHVAAKAAVIRMTEAMACELGHHGIRVNVVSPGSTVTEPTRQYFYGKDVPGQELAARLLSFVPLGRPGEPEEVAATVAFLASDEAAYITGHNIVIDGGWTAGFNRDF